MRCAYTHFCINRYKYDVCILPSLHFLLDIWKRWATACFVFFISCCWRRTLYVLTSIRTTTNLKFGFSVTWKIKFFKYFCIFEKTPRVIICLKLLNFFFAFLCIGRHLISAMDEFLASYYIEMKTPKYCLVFLYCFFVSIQFEWDILLVL